MPWTLNITIQKYKSKMMRILMVCALVAYAYCDIVDECTSPPYKESRCDSRGRYYRNRETGKCERLAWGYCGTNQNSYQSIQSCEEKCKFSGKSCFGGKTAGVRCKSPTTKFYYDEQSGSCNPFAYGGCGGNTNNFDSFSDCQENCVKTPVVTERNCYDEAQAGNCFAHLTKYFYNKNTRRCENFVYGGCGGNGNNYDTLQECRQQCVKTTEPEVVYKTCYGKSDAGNCFAFFTKYFYNTDTGRCENFVYGGCGGNGNNYDTLQECRQQCVKTTEPEVVEKTCYGKADAGNCFASFTNYFYNTETGRCENFVYGGCGGNGNNYDTLQECNQKCKQTQNTCEMDKDPGICLAYFPKYYYDKYDQKCKSFIYGGCRGNANNFDTVEECQATCSVKPDVTGPTGLSDCSSPQSRGHCSGRETRYFFDVTRGTCKPFEYSGCGGNGNRYASNRECFLSCAHE